MTQAVSAGTLLNGKISYLQPVQGFRTGIEPLLLAASVPARPGERVIEAGTGAGAGLLALGSRVAPLAGTGVECDPAMANIAATNFAANNFHQLHVACAEIESWRVDGTYDHAFSNPPWHRHNATPSPEAGRRRAKMARPEMLETWVAVLASTLRHRGTLSLILPAALLCSGVVALEKSDCTEMWLLPLWPHAGEPAKLIILRGVRGGRGSSTVMPGLVLHAPGGGFTEEANGILRDGLGLAS